MKFMVKFIAYPINIMVRTIFIRGKDVRLNPVMHKIVMHL